MNTADPRSQATPDSRNPAERPRILCVDDEPRLLEGLALHLRRGYELLTAGSGAAGLEVLRREPDIAVVISDMRMPVMDGAAFLRQARALAPDATRMLLTGQADIESAAAAINEGGIFRFLRKPCPPPTLLTAITAALEQHRLLTAERVLLEQTLHGSIKLLTDLLTLTNPLAFGRASRTKQLIGELAARLGLRERWQVEVAGMLSQLGAITLPAETVEKLYYAQPLDAEEEKLAARATELTLQLLGNIPRIELVREMLARYFDARRLSALTPEQEALADTGARLLRAAVDFDILEAQGQTAAAAIDILRLRVARYHPELLDALQAIRGGDDPSRELRELPLGGLRIGMLFAEDLKLSSGVLLVPRGYEVTAGLIERISRLRPGACKEPVRMILPVPPAPP
ncbi:MAG: response regulator [Stagnimonas sp.]|nr:response regulator [Stagnimonas sp.]